MKISALSRRARATAVVTGVLLVAAPCAPAFAAGSGVFTAFLSFGSASTAVALGDINNNPTLDAIVAPSADAAESFWLGAGNGTFSAHPTVPTFGAGDSRDIELGRLNGDAFLDVIVANHAGQPETVWLNDGSGVFAPQPTMPPFGGGDSTSVAFGDLDSDGDLDAVVANDITAAETVWMNNGSGVFTAHTVVPSFGAGDSYEVAMGDRWRRSLQPASSRPGAGTPALLSTPRGD